MDISIIKKAGLSESQAKCYLSLIQHGAQTPVELANDTDENRTNTYAILNRLVDLNLAIKNDEDKKTTFSATHPSNLEALVEKRRKIMARNEQDVKQNISSLIDLFYAYNELPGTLTLEGIDGIKTAYNDILKTNKDHYLIRSIEDKVSLGDDFMHDFIEKRVKLGIRTFALTHDNEAARRHINDGKDTAWLYERHTIPKGVYDAPVEIDVYGDKVALIAYGNTQMATIITSPPIAEAMKQIIRLIASLIEKKI